MPSGVEKELLVKETIEPLPLFTETIRVVGGMPPPQVRGGGVGGGGVPEAETIKLTGQHLYVP